MDRETGRLTVFFEEPFWTGVFECIWNGRLRVCRVIFGSEPKDGEVYDFILRNYYKLKYSSEITADIKKTAGNPKRIRREVRKSVKCRGVGTKSQLALKLQREQSKVERKIISRERREAEKQRQFELKRQKRKKKRRGR